MCTHIVYECVPVNMIVNTHVHKYMCVFVYCILYVQVHMCTRMHMCIYKVCVHACACVCVDSVFGRMFKKTIG